MTPLVYQENRHSFNNEMRLEFMSIQGLNTWATNNSSSRATMFASHFGQRLVIDGADDKYCYTGLEHEFAKYTMKVKMPCHAHIIAEVPKYPDGNADGHLGFNPETIVVYENVETGEVDYISIPYYTSNHQYFGFKNKLNQHNINKIRPGAHIAKDTVFADTPSISESGSFRYGINANMALMSLNGTSEDGIIVRRGFLDKLKFRIYETRVCEFGSNTFPLNLYGTLDNYKPFPGIGEVIRDHGILMALREYDKDMSPVEMNARAVMNPDFIFDTKLYVRGGGGKVVDIRVIENNANSKNLPEAMKPYLQKYSKALLRFHRRLIEIEQQIRQERKRKFGSPDVKLSSKLHRLLVESYVLTNHSPERFKPKLDLLYRKTPLDEFRVEFVIEYEITPGLAFKGTDTHGGKGVFCSIREDHEMPVDEEGNVADMIMDEGSTISRMNLGRLYEQYFNATARDCTQRLKVLLGLDKFQTYNFQPEVFLKSFTQDQVTNGLSYLKGLFHLINPTQRDFLERLDYAEQVNYLRECINSKIKFYIPVNNHISPVEMVKNIEASIYKPHYGKVTFVNESGRKVVSKRNIRIAPLYMMLLEKIGDDWSAVSNAKLQTFGILSPVTKSEKFALPWRCSPTRIFGESEGRVFVGYVGREAAAEMIDRSNNPLTMRWMMKNILEAPKPTNIDVIVDRNLIPLGGSKPLQYINHIFKCAGFSLKYVPESP
jgi:DNA-directed RNA polymerase beta subunit